MGDFLEKPSLANYIIQGGNFYLKLLRDYIFSSESRDGKSVILNVFVDVNLADGITIV